MRVGGDFGGLNGGIQLDIYAIDVAVVEGIDTAGVVGGSCGTMKLATIWGAQVNEFAGLHEVGHEAALLPVGVEEDEAVVCGPGTLVKVEVGIVCRVGGEVGELCTRGFIGAVFVFRGQDFEGVGGSECWYRK